MGPMTPSNSFITCHNSPKCTSSSPDWKQRKPGKMFAICLMIFHVLNECGMRRNEFIMIIYGVLTDCLALLGTLNIRIKYDRFYSIRCWQALTLTFHRIFTDSSFYFIQTFHEVLSWQFGVQGPPRDLRMQLQVERLQSRWPSLPKMDRKVVGSYEGDHARSDCYLVEVGVSVFHVFFFHTSWMLSYSCCLKFWKDPTPRVQTW